MTETVPRWIIYWCVHIHSQGKLNESMWRWMMLLCMVEVHSFFCDVFVRKWGPRPRTSSRCYHSNKSAATFKKGIFLHLPWVPNCMQNLTGGWKFSFPKMFDSYRDLFLSNGLEEYITNKSWGINSSQSLITHSLRMRWH